MRKGAPPCPLGHTGGTGGGESGPNSKKRECTKSKVKGRTVTLLRERSPGLDTAEAKEDKPRAAVVGFISKGTLVTLGRAGSVTYRERSEVTGGQQVSGENLKNVCTLNNSRKDSGREWG